MDTRCKLVDTPLNTTFADVSKWTFKQSMYYGIVQGKEVTSNQLSNVWIVVAGREKQQWTNEGVMQQFEAD